jgi:hypothetical protein
MKRIICLVIVLLFLTATAIAADYSKFSSEFHKNYIEYGRPEIIVETGTKIIVLFKKDDDKFQRIEMDKATGDFKVTAEIRFHD